MTVTERMEYVDTKIDTIVSDLYGTDEKVMRKMLITNKDITEKAYYSHAA